MTRTRVIIVLALGIWAVVYASFRVAAYLKETREADVAVRNEGMVIDIREDTISWGRGSSPVHHTPTILVDFATGVPPVERGRIEIYQYKEIRYCSPLPRDRPIFGRFVVIYSHPENHGEIGGTPLGSCERVGAIDYLDRRTSGAR